jgi:hypothetical protein
LEIPKFIAVIVACLKMQKAVLASLELWGLSYSHTSLVYCRLSTLERNSSSYETMWPLYDLTPKGPRPFFGPFLKFGQAIVDAIFVQKISNFRWTCGLVLASRRTNFNEIPISSLGAMLQKNYFEVRATWAAKKLFIFKLFWVEFFFINSSQRS